MKVGDHIKQAELAIRLERSVTWVRSAGGIVTGYACEKGIAWRETWKRHSFTRSGIAASYELIQTTKSGPRSLQDDVMADNMARNFLARTTTHGRYAFPVNSHAFDELKKLCIEAFNHGRTP